MNACVRYRRGIKGRIASLARRALLRVSDGAAAVRVGETDLILPLSHALPLYRADYKNYDTALPRLVGTLSAGTASYVVLDIGANVGDTAKPLLDFPNVKVIAVEGNPKFCPFLDENLAGYPDRTYIIKAFVGAPDVGSGYAISTQHGTASLVAADTSSSVPFVSIEDCMTAAHFGPIDFVKIDTDGFDIKIIRENMDFFTIRKPIIFFEFDLRFINQEKDWEIFNIFSNIGYDNCMIYLNTGEMLRTFKSNDEQAVAELRCFLRMAAPHRYVDVLISASMPEHVKCVNSELKFAM